MNKTIWAMLNDAEQALLREVEPRALDRLDEDALAELHDRIRRARNKYSKLYRRRASAQVDADAARGKASDKHARTAAKAEAFEEALATVSQRLARAARASAAELRDERLAAARADKGGGGRRRTAAPAATTSGGASSAKKQQRTPQKKRAAASSRAATKRAQARRDAR